MQVDKDYLVIKDETREPFPFLVKVLSGPYNMYQFQLKEIYIENDVLKFSFEPNETRRPTWPDTINDHDPKLHLLISEILRDINNRMSDILFV